MTRTRALAVRGGFLLAADRVEAGPAAGGLAGVEQNKGWFCLSSMLSSVPHIVPPHEEYVQVLFCHTWE